MTTREGGASNAEATIKDSTNDSPEVPPTRRSHSAIDEPTKRAGTSNPACVTVTGLVDQLRTQASEMERLGALVRADVLLLQIADLVGQLGGGATGAILNLAEAAETSGYSADYLGRLVRSGAIPNAGRNHAPRIRMEDLPRKAPNLGLAIETETAEEYPPHTREQVAIAAINPFIGGEDGEQV